MAHPIEAILRALDTVADSVELTDANFRLVYVNRAFTTMTGWLPEEVMGRTPAELLRSSAHDASFYGDIEATIGAGQEWRGRMIGAHRDGSDIIQDAIISPVQDETGQVTHYVAIKRDVTEREQLQAQLLRARRLASVGRLASAVGHEINNPLAYMLGNLEFVLEVLDGRDDPELAEVVEALRDTRDGARRVRDITAAMARLGREDAPQGAVDLAQTIEHVCSLLGHQASRRARLVRDVDEIPLVAGNGARVGQVVLDLVLNALEALPEGRPDAHEVRIRAFADGEAVILQVTDTGSGVPDELVDQIFDPFFTTKEVGQGPGLGLAVCHSIVTEIGGSISVSGGETGEEGDGGATFEVRFPVASLGRPRGEAGSE